MDPEQNKIIETINLKFEPNKTLYRNRVMMGPNQTSNVPEQKAYDFLLENLTCNQTPMYNEDSNDSNNQSDYSNENNSSRETQNIKASQPELTIQPANLPTISNNIPPATVTWRHQIVKRQNQPNRFDIYYFPNKLMQDSDQLER